VSIVWWIILVVLKNITNAISNGQTDILYSLLFWFLWLSLLYYISIIISRNRINVTIRPVWRSYFYKKYMNLFLQLDNSEVEKIWTWRLIAIIDKWFHTHVGQMVMIIDVVIPNIIQIIMSLIFIFLVNITYWFFVLFLMLLLAGIVRHQQKKAQDLRRYRKNLNIWIMRWFVKILMSKFEILNTNKWSYEIDKLTKTLEKNRINNIQQKNITIWVDLWLRLFVDSITFVMILFFGFWLFSNKINIWEFAGLIWIVYFLDKALWQINNHYVQFLKNYVEIEKLREIFDTIPVMSWYNTWKDFDYKSW
jgi:ABC-type multidrug transport system fused ATPase/permease subunit